MIEVLLGGSAAGRDARMSALKRFIARAAAVDIAPAVAAAHPLYHALGATAVAIVRALGANRAIWLLTADVDLHVSATRYQYRTLNFRNL